VYWGAEVGSALMDGQLLPNVSVSHQN
jgi:hypothetical protein